MKFVKRNTTKGSEGSNVTIKSYSNSSSSSSSSLTSHNIWGQPFDGTNDVTGDMQNVGSITATGNIQTDGDIIIKQLDTDGNEVEGGDLTMSVENADAQFSGKENYIFDGKIKGNSAEITNNIEVGGKGSFDSNLTVKGISKLKDVTSNNISNADTIRTKNLESYGNSTLNDVTSNNITNSDTIKTKNLEVTGSAHFFELIIDKIKAAGGAALFTPANGFNVDIVESVTDGYKLYWQADDGSGNQADNMWKVNDQALCMSFNQAKEGTNHNISNKYYWSLVTAVSDTNQPVSIEEKKYHYIVISTITKDGTVNPEIGDTIAMLGYRGTDDKKRQSAIYISAYSSLDNGLTAPLLAQYQGINDFNLESHRKSYFDAIGAKFVGNFEVSNGQTIEDYINNKIDGAKSVAPYIGANGNWFIWNPNTKAYKDSGVKAEGKDGASGTNGTNGKDAEFYKLQPVQELAVVDKNGTLGISLMYNIKHIKGTNEFTVGASNAGYYVRFKPNTSSNYISLSLNTTAPSYTNSSYQTNYHKQSTKIEYLTIQLVSGGLVKDTRVVPVQFAASATLEITDSIKTTVQDNTTSITDLAGKVQTNTNNISSITQKANSIESKVTSNTTTINNLSGSVTSLQSDMSDVKQTAESITSTVSSMKDEMIGENCMLGLNGQGWSSNTIYQDAGNSFHCESTDWFQSHPIADFSGDYTFSFNFWGGNMQIKILDFTQTYYDDGIYDQYVDFSWYKPCKILTTSSNVSNVDLTNYATSGTSSTWTYTNTEAITLAVGDNVAVRVTNNTNSRYNSIYGTVSAINTSTKSVTVKAIALLDQPNTICTLSCPTDKKDGTDINSLHHDDKLSRYWIRFKESSASAKTFVMLFKNLDTSSIGYISRLMIEEGVERPHKYNSTGQASQSMIKQTANEIIAQVNDTYVKIGDGNITINGDTKVNGSLTLNDSKQGFLLLGNGGTTEISPKSIGSYTAFKDRTSNVIRTHYLSDIHGELNVGTNNYAFFWSVTQKLGTYKKGDYIKLTNYTNDVVTSVGTDIGTPYAKFYINENGTQTKAIDLGVKNNVDIDYYTVVNDNADIQVTGQFHIYAPKSIWNQARGIDTNIPNIPFISVTVEWDNEVPNKNSFMLIGYDGFGVNFGTNKTVYCGAEGFIANYGDSFFKITSDGIVEKKNGANVEVINGSSSIHSPSYYNLKEGVDTILCKSGYIIITLPSNPYQGQSVKIFDKSPQEVYVNFNGYMVGANSDYNSRTHQTKYALDGTVVRTFTFIGDTWFMEYMG